MKENERQNGREALREHGAPHLLGTGVSFHREPWGRWFLSSKVAESRGGLGGASDDNMSLACGALHAKVSSETPVANEDHCSAQVATVTVVGGAEWTNGAVRS